MVMQLTGMNKLDAAREGDVEAFGQLFDVHRGPLGAYLYRLTANREDAEDLLQETFVKGFDGISEFRGDSSLKNWLFTIATNLARNHFRALQRWARDTQDRTKAHAHDHPEVMEAVVKTAREPEGAFTVRQHINYCFTCVAKTLIVEQQIAVLLKDVFSFKTKEIARIMASTEAVVKHHLHKGRMVMVDVFEARCALISKTGICNQCSALGGFLNDKHLVQMEISRLDLVKRADCPDRKGLLKIRAALAAEMDPFHDPRGKLHDLLLELNQSVNEC